MIASDHPKAAPGELDVIRQFVNTHDLDTGEDILSSPEALRAWFVERELLGAYARLTDGDVGRVACLREAIRKLLLANNGGELDTDALETLNATADAAQLRARFDERCVGILAPAGEGVEAALGRVLAIVLRSMAEGTWPRLKACPAESCEWAFYDWSKNRSGTWCSMRTCGNRTKARNYRRRHSGAE